MKPFQTDAEWQCVLIAWGDKYPVALINRLAQTIVNQSKCAPKMVLITDQPQAAWLSFIQVIAFPAYWNQPVFKTSGCHAKLVMFDQGVLEPDRPAIYVDLDTVIKGNMQALLGLLREPSSVAILPSAILRFGRFSRLLYRITDKRRYARGNSSIVVFHPAHCHYIAQQFKTFFARYPDFSFRPMIADERWISWVAQPFMQAVPHAMVTKFTAEYMHPLRLWLLIKAYLPWVRQRRQKQIAVTLNGLLIKPEKLLSLEEGAVIIDEKNRKMIWSTRTLGHMKKDLLQAYAPLFSK